MSKYYKPTIEDFILGLEYQVKEKKAEEWETKRITRDSYMAQGAGLAELHVIMHDLYTKDAKNEYRVRFVDGDMLLNKGFTKSTPVFLDDRQYNNYISRELAVTQNGCEFTIKDRENNTMFEGVILNEATLDNLLSMLDLDGASNHKLRRKLETAVYE